MPSDYQTPSSEMIFERSWCPRRNWVTQAPKAPRVWCRCCFFFFHLEFSANPFKNLDRPLQFISPSYSVHVFFITIF
jgi:hypothetical protein